MSAIEITAKCKREIDIAYNRGLVDGSNSRLEEFRRAEERVREQAYDAGVRSTMKVFNIKVPEEFQE